MKKTFRNIRTLAALLMAGAAFAACSSSDDNAIEQQPANPGEQVYTLTVNATKDGGSQTRALNLDGEKLVASWETTDYIAVINKNKSYSPSGSLKPTNISADGNSATLTGEVTGVAEGDDLILTYHFHSISDFADQNGRLNGDATYSAEAYDQAEATVTVASIDGSGNITTTADASFKTQTAMIKFTLQDNAATPNKINATSLNVKATITLPAPLSTITEDLFTFTIAPEAYTYNGNGILYYALPSAATLAGPIATKLKADPYNLTTITESDVVTALASATITFTASDGVNTYTVDKTGYPFAAGSYYTSTLTMTKQLTYPITLSAVTSDYVGSVVTTDGNVYATVAAASAASKTAVAVIAYVGTAGSVDASSASYKGLAIALSDANGGSNCKWADSFANCLSSSQTDAIATALGFKNGITCTSTLTAAGHSSHGHAAATAAASNNSTAAPTGTSGWFMPSVGQWNLIVQGLATKKAGSAVTTALTQTENPAYKADNLNSVITDAGGTGFQKDCYWASTEETLVRAWVMDFWNGYATNFAKNTNRYVRSIIAF